MIYRVIPPARPIRSTVEIPASKSISNRLLIIHALSGREGLLENLSDSDDTAVMIKALSSQDDIKDVGHAGTSMRFLAALYSCRPGTVTLTGSDRMKERPIGPLVDALRSIGADIQYVGEEGFPPLKIHGKKLKGGKISIPGDVSSQFISAILMIAPLLEGGLELELTGSIVSASYINMTLELMRQSGIDTEWEGSRISVAPGPYLTKHTVVESDWSAASYWYSIAMLHSQSEINIRHFEQQSLQGDSVLMELFSHLGMDSVVKNGVLSLVPDGNTVPGEHGISESNSSGKATSDQAAGATVSFDFTNCPDLVQTLAVLLCLCDIPFKFTGTRTLRIKETDRIAALQAELKKLGYLLESEPAGSFLAWKGTRCDREEDIIIETYHDHRMAMAFAPACLKTGEIRIKDPMVVTKSYPGFWEDLARAGFTIEKE